MMRFFRDFLLAAACIAVAAAPVQAAGHTKESLKTVKKNVDEEKAVLVDVRDKSEWDDGHIKDAVLLPLRDLLDGVDAEKLAKKLPKGKIIYTHCVIGARALTAGHVLEKHGYSVRPLKPGYKELIRAGFPKADE